MKKSFPVHISGHIYYFDEDAYERLNTYYNNLRRTFVGEDGKEIVDDIESRVAELFADNHIDQPFAVVTIEEVNDVITRMGQPEELADESAANEVHADEGERHTTPPPFNGTAPEPPEITPAHVQRRLYRNMNNKVIAGVLGGLACYWGVNVTALRVAVVLVALFSYVWPLILLYVVGWLFIPAAETPRQILEMEGRQVTVDSVGRTTIFGSDDARARENNFWESVGRAVGVVMMSIVGLIGLALGFAALIMMVVGLAGIVSYIGWGSIELIPYDKSPWLSISAVIVLGITLLIPAIAGVWAACCTLFKAKGVSRRTAITFACVEFVLIVASIALFAVVKDAQIHYSNTVSFM